MRQIRRYAVLALVSAVPLARASAQNAQCAPYPTTGNARQTCDAAVDLTRAYTPIAGLLISGGNPVLGSAGASGGLGKFSVTLRANAVRLSVPNMGSVSSTGTVPQSDSLLAPAPLVEASLGLFRGIGNGLLAIDALGAAQLVPNEKVSADIRVDPGAPRLGPVSLGIGFGARIGVLPEGGVLPAVAVSIMRRGIPTIGYGNIAAGDQIAADVKLRATNVRVTAGKRFSVLMVGAGLGWSKYTGDANADFRVAAPVPGGSVSGSVAVPLNASRTVVFADAGLDFKFIKLMAEIGHQSGKDQNLGTTFTGYDDTKGTTFYSVGLRMGL
jgi:hypothetical protein